MIDYNIVNVFLGEYAPGGGIRLCHCGYEHCDPDHHFSAARAYYLIHIIVSGKGTFSVGGGVTHTLSAHDAFLIRPGEVNYYKADSVDPWYYMWIGITGPGADEFIASSVEKGRSVFHIRDELVAELERLYRAEARETDYHYRLIAFTYKLFGSIKADAVGPVKKPDIVRQAVSFIENNFFRGFDVGSLAAEVGMSRSHFTTVFTAAMGTSPYAFLTDYRISQAKSMLESYRELSVTEIAFSVGFASLERFSAAFRKSTGMSPREYRTLHTVDYNTTEPKKQ